MTEDEDLSEEDLPEWQRESLGKSREALESGEFLTAFEEIAKDWLQANGVSFRQSVSDPGSQ